MRRALAAAGCALVAQAAPTELSTVPAFFHAYFDRAFAPSSDEAWSPARHTDTLAAPALVAAATTTTKNRAERPTRGPRHRARHKRNSRRGHRPR
ncbi:hypothetical protein [Capillimicrobium parvum]|uniref:Uncharacterized protein n=1 Tax=Capillimicrobium parvum TaxID=2884022 RepID=A0A9E7C673_9ACTN|nr:hypothetical protein [Capillimicrobium parvum]UGS38668.1 hypothetical protein DSM104329_05098 [Capillimicrobium parvum]